MENCYINGIGNVSAQDSNDNSNFLNTLKELTTNVVYVSKPNYKDYIKPAMIRRMGNGVKYGFVASSIALQEAKLDMPEAIITGTGMGCLIDSEKFLQRLVFDNESFLTPTAFIQSTHNTVGAQIALSLQCNSYNVTYGSGAFSFETTLFDAMLMIQDGGSDILVGGVEELEKHTIELHKLIKHVKEEESFLNGFLGSNTKGSIYGEGSQFFVLQNHKSVSSYAKLIDLSLHNTLDRKDIESELYAFLANNMLKIEDIDAVLLGNNADVDFDIIYQDLQNSIFSNTQQLYYKHMSGEYNTVSAFGMYLTSLILKNQVVPDSLKLNNKHVPSFKNILLYNQYRGENHSFILLSAC